MRPHIFRATNIVLGLLCLMYFLTYIDRVNISTVIASNQFLKEIPLTKVQMGFVFSAFAYPYLLFQVIGGWVADKFGPRKALTVCGIIWAGATIASGLVHGMVSLFVARVILGFGEGATFPTATRVMSDWTPKEKRGFAQGITHACSRLGNSLTPWLVAFLILTISWRGSFIIIGVISTVWALAWGLYFRDDPNKHSGVTSEEIALLPPYASKKTIDVKVPWSRLIPRIVPVTVVYFCYGWILWLFLSWIPSFFKGQYHLDLQKSALFASGVFISGVVGDTLGGLISDKLYEKTHNPKFARSNMVALMMFFCGISLVPIIYTHNMNVVALALSAGFFFAEMTIGPMWAIPMDIAPKFSGTASGLMNTGSALAAIVSPVVGGYLIQKTGNWMLPFIVSMGVILVGAALSFTMHPERPLAEITAPTGAAAPAISDQD
ncbi:MAG: MFS transporter [Desulfobaccales bacterium]